MKSVIRNAVGKNYRGLVNAASKSSDMCDAMVHKVSQLLDVELEDLCGINRYAY